MCCLAFLVPDIFFNPRAHGACGKVMHRLAGMDWSAGSLGLWIRVIGIRRVRGIGMRRLRVTGLRLVRGTGIRWVRGPKRKRTIFLGR